MRMFRRCGVAALLLLCSGGLAAAADAHFQASDDFVLTGSHRRI